MLVSARYFTFTNLAASSGGGMEIRSANLYNKMPVVMMKNGIYVSRMTTGARRVIHIEYSDMRKSKPMITDLFSTLKQYEPGVGTCKVHGNTLVGFKGEETVCLELKWKRTTVS